MEIKLSPQPEDDNNSNAQTDYQEPNQFKSVVVDNQPQQMGFGDDSLTDNNYSHSSDYNTGFSPNQQNSNIPNQVYNNPNSNPNNFNQAYQNPNANQQYKTKFCKHCGKTIPIDAVICTQCGRQVEQLHQGTVGSNTIINNISNINNGFTSNGSVSNKNSGIALLLAVIGFFGLPGLHRFYTGKIGTGLLYLFTYGLFGIGTIIDIITIASGNFKDGNGLPLK